VVREEAAGDFEAIRKVNRLAFGQDTEAELVDRLRAEGLIIVSLVAVVNGAAVGHILFSRLAVERCGPPLRAASLAPVAVRPEWQRQGIGGALVRAGLEACRARGVEAVVVVGHPKYYPRFGFSAELARRLEAPFGGDALMAIELVPGALAAGGRLRFPGAFGDI